MDLSGVEVGDVCLGQSHEEGGEVGVRRAGWSGVWDG